MAREKRSKAKRVLIPDMARLGPSKGTHGEVLINEWFGYLPHATQNNARVTGSPDLTFIVNGLLYAVFIDGRFWHDPVFASKRYRPHHRINWVQKAKVNRQRDRKYNRLLQKEGAVVVRIWDECFSGKARTEKTLGRVSVVLHRAQPGERWTLSGNKTRLATKQRRRL